MKKTDIFIVIPAHNEATIIATVLHEVEKSGFTNIILVDDGSTDETYTKALANTHVVRHSLNRGKGAAVKTGIEGAKLLGASGVVTIDGDGQHDPRDITKMIKKLAEGYDVVLGSRLQNPKGMPPIKIIANYCGNFFTWLIYGLWVTDSQSGFRAYSKKAIDTIVTRADRYEYDSEIIKEISRHKLKFIEVPIKVRYTEYSKSKQQKQTFINGLKTLYKMIITG